MLRRLLLTLIFFLSHNLCAQELIKVIAVEYPPFLSSQSKNFGTSFDLLDHYAKDHFKIAYEPLFVPPGRAQQMISQGEWCMTFIPPASDDIKARFVRLSQDNVKLGLFRIAEHDEFSYSSLSELKGSVAILRTNSLGRMHTILEDAGLKLVHLETIKQGIQMLLAGRVDYAFGDNTAIETYPEINGINTLQFSKVPLSEYPVGFYYNIDCEDALYKTKP